MGSKLCPSCDNKPLTWQPQNRIIFRQIIRYFTRFDSQIGHSQKGPILAEKWISAMISIAECEMGRNDLYPHTDQTQMVRYGHKSGKYL